MIENYFHKIFPVGGSRFTVEFPAWKTEPETESGAGAPSPGPPPSYPAFSISHSSAHPSDMISMEMPGLGGLGPHHPAHHQQSGQLSPGYEAGGDKKNKRECTLSFVLEHGLYCTVRCTACYQGNILQLRLILAISRGSDLSYEFIGTSCKAVRLYP